jgi:hypothetical protein
VVRAPDKAADSGVAEARLELEHRQAAELAVGGASSHQPAMATHTDGRGRSMESGPA